MEATAITAVRWVPRGKAREIPEVDTLDMEDVKQLALEMKDLNVLKSPCGFESDNDEPANSSHQDISIPDGVDKSQDVSLTSTPHTEEPRNMPDSMKLEDDTNSNSGNEDEADDKNLLKFPGNQFFGVLESDIGQIAADPYLKAADSETDSVDEDDADAQRIRPTDSLVLAASADPEIPTLEVYVYDHETSAFYVHHEIMVGSPILCVEWLDCAGQSQSPGQNFCATGSFGHGMIEIWDLDVIDQLEPVAVLGDPPQMKKKKSSKKASKGATSTSSHQAEVICLAKNTIRSNILASGSADQTVKVWDLTQLSCAETYCHHTDKVQAINWHWVEESVLLTAGYDKAVHVTDIRMASAAAMGQLTADAESCAWSRHNLSQFYVSTEDGCVRCFDLRKLSPAQGDCPRNSTEFALWTLPAHTKPCSGVTDCSVPGLLMTCSLDETAKIWKLPGFANSSEKNVTSTSVLPSLVFERDLKAGPLFSVHANPDEPTVFSFGGKVVVVWDVGDTNVVNRAFHLPELEETASDED